VRVALRLLAAVVGDIDLAAENRLHSDLFRLLVQVDRAGEGAVVGERDRGHLQLRRSCRQRRNPASSVEDGVLGVDVEVDERSGLGHGSTTLQVGPDWSSRAQVVLNQSAWDAAQTRPEKRRRRAAT
jgi:hypothetical protein